MKRFLFLIIATFLLIHCKNNSEIRNYSVGQEWNYKTRPGEEKSTLKILKIEEYPQTGKVIHISIGGFQIRSAASTEVLAHEFTHIPISEKALNESVTELKNEKVALPKFMEGYTYWKKEFDKGQAGIFSISVAQIMSQMEEGILTGRGLIE